MKTFSFSADAFGCRIEVYSKTALGKPQYNNQPPRQIYSCVPGSSSTQYEVHVLSVYEVINTRSPSAGDAAVNIVSAGQSGRPIVLVFASYEPVNWILNLPSGVTISRVILVSYLSSVMLKIRDLRQQAVNTVVNNTDKIIFSLKQTGFVPSVVQHFRNLQQYHQSRIREII